MAEEKVSLLKVGSINPNYKIDPIVPHDAQRLLSTITHGQDPTIWLFLSEDEKKVHAVSSSLMEKLYGVACARERLYREAKRYVDESNRLASMETEIGTP